MIIFIVASKYTTFDYMITIGILNENDVIMWLMLSEVQLDKG